MRAFRILEHTADTILEANGRDLDELFGNAALGMFTVIAEPAKAAPAEQREISLADNTTADLLHAWLSELLYLFDTEGLFFCAFECRVEAGRLAAVARGEPFDADRHEYKTEIKAVTHHELKVEQTGAGWRAQLLLDL